MSAWYVIETAPTDGISPLLLAFYSGDGNLEVHIGRFCEPLGIWCDDDNGDAYAPTFWMPLPEPPIDRAKILEFPGTTDAGGLK